MPDEVKITDKQQLLVQSDDLPNSMHFGPMLVHLKQNETWNGLMQVCYSWCREISKSSQGSSSETGELVQKRYRRQAVQATDSC